MQTRFRHLRWRFWRPSVRRCLQVRTCRFLELWWNVSWLYLASIVVLHAFLVNEVTVEPTVILLCITMVLTVQNIRANRMISILTAVLGAIAALLSLPAKAEVGALNLELWKIVGLMIGLSAFTVLGFMFVFASESSRMRRRSRRKTRKPTA